MEKHLLERIEALEHARSEADQRIEKVEEKINICLKNQLKLIEDDISEIKQTIMETALQVTKKTNQLEDAIEFPEIWHLKQQMQLLWTYTGLDGKYAKLHKELPQRK